MHPSDVLIKVNFSLSHIGCVVYINRYSLFSVVTSVFLKPGLVPELRTNPVTRNLRARLILCFVNVLHLVKSPMNIFNKS